MYYFTLLFLLAFTTPVLITTSLNVYITSAVSLVKVPIQKRTTSVSLEWQVKGFHLKLQVKGGPHEIICHHQWLTLGACVVMW